MNDNVYLAHHKAYDDLIALCTKHIFCFFSFERQSRLWSFFNSFFSALSPYDSGKFGLSTRFIIVGTNFNKSNSMHLTLWIPTA